MVAYTPHPSPLPASQANKPAMMHRPLHIAFACLATLPALTAQGLRTPAEETDFQAGPTMYDPLMKFVYDLDAQSDLMSVSKITETLRGRDVLLCTLSNPAVRRPADALNSGKPIVLIVNNVHGGEVAGKDASLILMRDLLFGDERQLLDEAIVLVVPTINPDGAEARRRTNEQGYDMNRDYLKQESQEISALVTQVINKWQPQLHIDTHHGGSAPYTLTYQTCMNPAGDAELIRFGNEEVLTTVRQALRAEDYDGFWYTGPRQTATGWAWNPTSVEPRKQHVYSTLANMVGFLFETPSGSHRVIDNGTKVVAIPGEERYRHQVRGQYLGLRAMVQFAADNPEQLLKVVADAKRRATRLGGTVSEEDQIVIAYEQVEKYKQDFWVRDASDTSNAGYQLVNGSIMTKFVPTKTTTRPWGYLLSPQLAKIVPTLLDHEISVQILTEPLTAQVEAMYATEVSEGQYFQGHYLKQVKTTTREEERSFPEGSFFVPMAQPKSNLIGYLLESETEDSLATWNHLDEFIQLRATRIGTAQATSTGRRGGAAGRRGRGRGAGRRGGGQRGGQRGGQTRGAQGRRGRGGQGAAPGQSIPIFRVMRETAIRGTFVDHFDAGSRRRYIRK